MLPAPSSTDCVATTGTKPARVPSVVLISLPAAMPRMTSPNGARIVPSCTILAPDTSSAPPAESGAWVDGATPCG